MADKKLKMVFELDGTDTVEGKLRKVAGQVKDVGTEFDETESAGKQMARGLSQVASDIEADMADAKSAAERLGEALGPEFAADADRGEQAVMGLVAQLRAAGLTYDDIRMDADELGAAIKQLDETGKNLDGVSSAAKTVEGDFKRVSTEADNTRSVVANFAGNAVQELPGIGAAMGPLNMAIGQFGEYAAEGNIKLSNFVMAGAGLGIVSAALIGITGHMKEVAEVKAFDKAQVDAYRESILDADTEVQAIVQTLRDAGKVSVSVFSDWKIDDVTSALNDAGLSLEQFAMLIEGGEPKIQAWAAAARAAGGDVEAIGLSVLAAQDQTEKFAKAQDAAAASIAFFGDAASDTGKEVDRTTRSYEQLKSAVDILTGALSDRDAFDQAIQAQNELRWAQAEAAKGGADGQAAVEEATRASIDATIAYIDTLGGIPESKATSIAALIDEGSFAEAERRLGILARNQTVNVDIIARGGAGYGVGARAAGGPVSAGMPYLVGEQGPEVMVPSVSGTVVPNDRLGGSVTNNITINMPPGSKGQDVVNAIRTYERTNGKAWRA